MEETQIRVKEKLVVVHPKIVNKVIIKFVCLNVVTGDVELDILIAYC